MTMRIYLSSFYPLICTNKGRKAVEEFNLPPYIDGSCRREPDFENEYPVKENKCGNNNKLGQTPFTKPNHAVNFKAAS